MSSTIYVGIDVAKASLVVASSTSQLGVFDNTAEGHRQLFALLRKYAVELVTLESTGVYSKDVAIYLRNKRMPVATVAPDRVRYFAQSLGQLAKTDPIDAKVIARFGEVMQPRLDAAIDERLEQAACFN